MDRHGACHHALHGVLARHLLARGLPEALAQACDTLIRIPQAGRADSLNLAVATGVALYEVRRPALPPNSPIGGPAAEGKDI
mgnify:CR=1 FL=1